MRVQCLAPDLFPQQVSLFFQQRVSSFFRTRTTTTDQQTSLLTSDRHVLGVRYEASPRARHREQRPTEDMDATQQLELRDCKQRPLSVVELIANSNSISDLHWMETVTCVDKSSGCFPCCIHLTRITGYHVGPWAITCGPEDVNGCCTRDLC